MGTIRVYPAPTVTGNQLSVFAATVRSTNKGHVVYDFECYVDSVLDFTAENNTEYATGYIPALGDVLRTGTHDLFPWRGVRVHTDEAVPHYWMVGRACLWRMHDALIRCENCSLAYMAHTNGGTCLYEPTTYKRHRLATHEPQAYDIIRREWVRVLED